MAREGGTYYLFSTGDPAGVIGNGNIQIRTSRNLRQWTYAGTVFATKPAWITAALGNIPNLWAPDISFFNGLWHLYYAGSSFGSNNSVIGLATTPTLDPRSPRYHWTDRGLVFRSTTSDDYNAIDPSLVSTPSGGKWLVFGSYWSGIKLISLDAATGKPASTSPTIYSLAQRPAPDAEEGAGITYHDGYYYLIVSFDTCCAGIGSTYRIMVGRSTTVTGPYVDPAGTTMMNSGGMELQGSDEGMIGPGSSSVYPTAPGPPRLPLLRRLRERRPVGAGPAAGLAALRLAGDGPAADPGSRQQHSARLTTDVPRRGRSTPGPVHAAGRTRPRRRPGHDQRMGRG